VGCGGTFLSMIRRLLCKCGLHFFPLHTVLVVFRVVSPAATTLGLFPRGRATTGNMEASTREASRCVAAVSLRVSKTLAALALQ
jgi:hypothetical protein